MANNLDSDKPSNIATISSEKNTTQKNHDFTNIFTEGAKNFTPQTQSHSRLNIIFTTIKRAKDDSENPAGCFRNLYSIICNSYFGISVLFLYCGFSITMLVIGALNINECKIDKKIPIWLIVYGIFGIIICLLRVMTSISIRLKSRKSKMIFHEPIYVFVLSVGIGTFLFIWFCLGNAWIFSVKSVQQSLDNSISTYCNQLCYDFAFWIIICFWIVIGLVVLFILGIMIYFAMSIFIRMTFKSRRDLINK